MLYGDDGFIIILLSHNYEIIAHITENEVPTGNIDYISQMFEVPGPIS